MQIRVAISNHPNPSLNALRFVELISIQFMHFRWSSAKFQMEVIVEDTEGNNLNLNRIVWTEIDNNNKVDANGMVINEKTYPKNEEESDEDYQARLQALKDAGTPEFDFWWTVSNQISMEQAIIQGIQLMDFNGLFD